MAGKKLKKNNEPKQSTAKKTAQAITSAKTWPKCNAVDGCKKPSVVMKRYDNGTKERHYCANHSDMIMRKPLLSSKTTKTKKTLKKGK